VAALLAESFEVLAREQPVAYAALCARLRGLGVALSVDEESFAALFDARGASVAGVEGTEGARVLTHHATVLAVLEGELTLADAVLTDAVRVVGPLDLLLRLHEGLVLYVQGAARCPGFGSLLRRLRAMAAPQA
jgi:hypothetical protein